jgi:hypothetical protein
VAEERKGYFLSNAIAFTDSERLVGNPSAILRIQLDPDVIIDR